MKFARFDVDRPPGPDTVTVRARLKGAQGFAKPVDLLVLSASAPREALDRFLQGGARLAELADGNLLQVLEVGYEEGRAFLATEASAGEPLSKLLEKCKERGLAAMPAPLAFGIGAELAKALAHAHAHADPENKPDPVTHGALRGEAITLGEDGAVKLGGFVPWRAAPSPEDDVEKLVELVAQWVPDADKKLVRESAGGVSSAAQLRKAWSAYQALHWPAVAPDARRTWFAFSRGEATQEVLESKLGPKPTRTKVPVWGFAVAGGAVVLVAAALLWPSEEPARPPEVVLAPVKRLPKPAAEKPFEDLLHVDGHEHHLTLPDGLPTVKATGELWFGERTAPPADAPQLFVAGTQHDEAQVATVPVGFWRLSGPDELRFFSWEPFDPRFRKPGVRQLQLMGLGGVPLVQPWLEVDSPGLVRHVPTGKHLMLEVSVPADAGTPKGPLLVAVSYGAPPSPSAEEAWPFALTRMALAAGQTSPTLVDAEQLAFTTLFESDRYEVKISEGWGGETMAFWPGWSPSGRAKNAAQFQMPKPGAVKVSGHVDGYEHSAALQVLQPCLSEEHPPKDCVDKCIETDRTAYVCYRYLATLRGPERAQAARDFLRLVRDVHPDHPYIAVAEELAALVTSPKEAKAPRAPASPEKR